jgi:hypothetical protein
MQFSYSVVLCARNVAGRGEDPPRAISAEDGESCDIPLLSWSGLLWQWTFTEIKWTFSSPFSHWPHRLAGWRLNCRKQQSGKNGMTAITTLEHAKVNRLYLVP